jgi:hypothetical protein
MDGHNANRIICTSSWDLPEDSLSQYLKQKKGWINDIPSIQNELQSEISNAEIDI